MSVDTQLNTSLDDKGGDINGDTPPPPLIVDGEVTTTTINNKQTNNNKQEEEVGGGGESNTEQVKGVSFTVDDKVGGDSSEDFPLKLLGSLDEQLGRPKWVVPVRANDELETLIKASIKLAKERRDKEFEECQRFYREGLTTSFIRILTDDAVKTWKPDIQLDIYNNSKYLVELCVYKIEDDSTYLLDLLAIVFNPSCKWNVFNSSEDPTSCVPVTGADLGLNFWVGTDDVGGAISGCGQQILH